MSEAGVRVLNEPVGVALVVGEPRVEVSESRNESGPSPSHFFHWGGASRIRRPMQRARETTENLGLSWRKQPRPESLSVETVPVQSLSKTGG